MNKRFTSVRGVPAIMTCSLIHLPNEPLGIVYEKLMKKTEAYKNLLNSEAKTSTMECKKLEEEKLQHPFEQKLKLQQHEVDKLSFPQECNISKHTKDIHQNILAVTNNKLMSIQSLSKVKKLTSFFTKCLKINHETQNRKCFLKWTKTV